MTMNLFDEVEDRNRPSLQEGDIIGSYTLRRYVGSGGLSDIWEAGSARNPLVALKIGAADIPHELIFDEFSALHALAHNRPEQLPKLYGFGDVGLAYLAIEFLEGRNGVELIESGDSRSWHRSITDIGEHVARGLAYMHDSGIVHRDVSPGNIFVGETRITLLDLGNTARAGTVGENGRDWIIGSPPYMSPEQIRRFPAEPSSDVWSFGSVLSYLATGKEPFLRETDVDPDIETLRRIVNADMGGLVFERHQYPRQVRPDEEPLIYELIKSCWNPTPSNRPDMGEIVRMFERG